MLPDNRGKSHVRIAFFTILAIHVVLLGALLLQGCKKTAEPTQDLTSLTPTNTYPPFADTSTPPAPPPATVETQPPTNYAPPTPPEPVTPPPAPSHTEAVKPAGAAGEHVVAQGDTFATLAKKYHVSVKAITAANQGVNPTRLKIGQKLAIPAPSAEPESKPKNGVQNSGDAAGGGKAYVVKSGDNLVRIARNHHVSVKELRAANHLKTDRITVGQKLVIPSAKAATASRPATETAAPAQ